VGRIERELGGRGIVGIGDNAQRREMARAHRLDWQTVVHPSAYVHPSAKKSESPSQSRPSITAKSRWKPASPACLAR